MESNSSGLLVQTPDDPSISQQVHELEQLYVFEDKNEILAFLTLHPNLHPLLERTYSRIKHSFNSAPIKLEFIHDPEEPENDHVTAFVQVKDAAEQTIKQFRLLKRNWWLEEMRTLPPQESILVNINLGFLSDGV